MDESLFSEMVGDMTKLAKAFVESDEFFDAMAQVSKKMFEALIKVGFTEDQALKITASQGASFKKN